MTPILVLVAALSITSGDSTRTVASSRVTPAPATVVLADSIVVEKSLRQLTLFNNGARVKTYMVALGQNPVGPKVKRGDNRTPEGLYYIEGRNPQSQYHLSLRVSYPSNQDRARAASLGVAPGGDIMIHGLPKRYAFVGAEHRLDDWTNGCIAVTNAEIEEIYRAVRLGAAILIKP